MIIPIKKIILEMSTALKRRKAFQQAGIIPPKNEYGYNFPQKKIFKKITNTQGKLLPGKELAKQLEIMGKLPNNEYQDLKNATRYFGDNKEIGKVWDKDKKPQFIIGNKDSVTLPLGFRNILHSHPEKNIIQRRKEVSSFGNPSGNEAIIPYGDKNGLPAYSAESGLGKVKSKIIHTSEDTQSHTNGNIFVNNKKNYKILNKIKKRYLDGDQVDVNKYREINSKLPGVTWYPENKYQLGKDDTITFNMSKKRHKYDLDGNLIKRSKDNNDNSN